MKRPTARCGANFVCICDESDARNALAALSARAYHRVLKLARTIADLARDEKIAPTHLAETLQYRPKLGMM
jgi:predicted ATPase with chaperone activity